MIKAGILQFKPVFGDIEANHRKIKKLIGRKKFDIAVIPELATTGYNFLTRRQALALSEDSKGPSFAFFEQLSHQTGGAIVWGFPERARGKLYNSAVMTTPKGDHFLYRKTHLFFREKEIFDRGNTGFNVFTWRKIRCGLMVCFDWIFPEATRTLALKGAQLICHPSNLVMRYCQDAMVTRSLENGVFCLTSNRIGTEKNDIISLTFTGGSQVTDVKGRRILSFSGREEAFRTVKLNPKDSDTKIVNKYNHLFEDRRVRQYRL